MSLRCCSISWGAFREGPEGLRAVSLGLRPRREVVGRSAVFSGEHFVLEETDWYLLNVFRLWWHYGISFLRLQMWVEEVMEKFMRYGGAGRGGVPGGARKADGEGAGWPESQPSSRRRGRAPHGPVLPLVSPQREDRAAVVRGWVSGVVALRSFPPRNRGLGAGLAHAATCQGLPGRQLVEEERGEWGAPRSRAPSAGGGQHSARASCGHVGCPPPVATSPSFLEAAGNPE